jgi:DNA-binding PadR family transcriptional regulator
MEGKKMKGLNGNDEILLLTILALKKNAYGATIMQHLAEVTGREWSIGAIYDPLYRLEKIGYVRSFLTLPTPERGGRSKRVYEVTERGLDALRRHNEIRRKISHGLNVFAPEK